MTDDHARRMELAREVAHRAYAPYSHFRVGAVAVAADGSEHVGCNVENAAYGSTVCAEANAITTAVAAGAREITSITVACLDGVESRPCGNCLQMMNEFGVSEVIVQDGLGGYQVLALEELLPRAFGPASLG